LPRGLRPVCGRSLRGTAGSNPAGEWLSLEGVMCLQVEVSASGQSLIQRSNAVCDVCDRESSIMSKPCPTGAVEQWKEKLIFELY
jgi:hypothetical protein